MTSALRAIPPERYGARLAACREAVAEHGFAALLIGVGPDLRYLTGFAGEPMERLTLLVVPRRGQVSFLVPRLEASKATATAPAATGTVAVVPFEETDDAAAIVGRLLRDADSAGDPIGISDHLWAMHVLGLQRAAAGARFESAAAVMRELRQVKDADEVRLLGLAAGAADRTIDAISAGRLIGRTEAEVGREIRNRLIDEGHDLADFAIVGSGPNSASPHHDAGERIIGAGEPIVLDIGGTLAGYLSDTTRTIWVAGPEGIESEPEFRLVYDLVRTAQARATAAVRPGVAAEQIDTIGRALIEESGYGEFFSHRIGHGIGLDVHEDPYMVSGNATQLQPGMAFSVEPGIYLPGRWGVRLENIVVCGAEGPEVLNQSSLELRAVRG
jgi:Xaa-Pro aminopeptidase